MSHSVLDSEDLDALKYIVTHVFGPQMPYGGDHSTSNSYSLAAAVASAAHLYSNHVIQDSMPEWHRVVRMLDNLQATIRSENLDRSQTISQFSNMRVGDVLAFFIRAQNAAVIFRKQENGTVYESFEVSPRAQDVMTTQGKLICSYPGPSIEVPNHLFNDESFLSQLVNFLVHMNSDVLNTVAATHNVIDAVAEGHDVLDHPALNLDVRDVAKTTFKVKDTPHPRYITELLTGILRGVGRPASIGRISKRVGDDVIWNNSVSPWRRSPLWLLIRVVLQTTLDRSTLEHGTYKAFTLFFICCLAKETICADLPNDLLQVMSAKISRRLRKLGSSASDWLSCIAHQACATLRLILEKRWREVEVAQRVSPIWAPSELNLTQDIQLSLSSSRDYLHNSLTNHAIHPVDNPFNPRHRRRGDLEDFLTSDGVFFEEAYHAEPYVTLYDVERTVEESIDDWVDRVTDHDEACVKLEILANKYSSSALKTYENNPELLSIMLLTTIELWVALDRIAVQAIPMLADYSPEIPTSLLEGLLLFKAARLYRLCRVHEYLSHRHSQCRWSTISRKLRRPWTVFPPTFTTDSFSVRFYRGSSHLQQLKAQIEQAGKHKVREKTAELESANACYTELQQKTARAHHEFTLRWRRRCVINCTKCALKSERSNMKIMLYEWPLPAEEAEAEAVVFELDCPVSFNMWRTATFHLLVDLCSPSVRPLTGGEESCIRLNKCASLRPYLLEHPRSRITLAHRRKGTRGESSIPTTLEQVCVDNRLMFYGYDGHTGTEASSVSHRVRANQFCTHMLPSGPYQNLQKYVDTTFHSSNQVIANQVDCDKNLSIHEYMAFGHLRSGGLLQWPNILRELRGRSLNFRHPEVHLLLAQAVSQVGPLEDLEWTWHQEIQQPSFCYMLLRELESLIEDVEANWLEGVTMDIICFLLRRLLASSPDSGVTSKVVELLRVVRQKVFCWVQELLEKLTRLLGGEEIRGFLRDAAAICRSTFDVDSAAIPKLLHSEEDVEVLISCAILIHVHTPSDPSCLSSHSRLLLDRDCRLSLTLESALRDVIRDDPSDWGIDLAIHKFWPDYRPGSKWTPLENWDSRWLSCTTAPSADQYVQVVQYNLLNGSLLFNGKPRGRLPNEILQHPLYILIFGEQALDVTPSDLPEMDYSTRAIISKHRVYFALRNADLIIRAKRLATDVLEIFELIPQERLVGDIPAVFIKEHAHWLNLFTSVLEIRPLNSLWEASPEHWKIYCPPGPSRMRKDCELLIDTRSKTWDMVSGLLKPLDSPQNLIITASLTDPNQSHSPVQLSVDLPRYGLSFYVDEDGDLRSRNMRGMVYDKNQSVGTLFGLVNYLVLKPKIKDTNAVELLPRCVLIPEGEVSFGRDGHHVCIEIDTYSPIPKRVPYLTYKIDTDLGCLTGNAGLTSKLYCAYLHALTSGCGVDPLTGRSGTEEALSLLRSAGCWSIIKLTSRDVELLSLIASMCPSRIRYHKCLEKNYLRGKQMKKYYQRMAVEKHFTQMQKVEWLNLPVNSQNHELFTVCKAIMEHHGKIWLFHESQSGLLQKVPYRGCHLLQRSTQGAEYLLPPAFSGQPSGKSLDVRYNARDSVECDSGEHRAYMLASTVYHRVTNARRIQNVLRLLKTWETVSWDASLSLSYDRSWLTPQISQIWLKVYRLLRDSTNEGKWFQLLFSLPAMVYASPGFASLVPVFVAFASYTKFRFEDPPPHARYIISDGYRPSPAILRGYVFHCSYPFGRSPENIKPAKTRKSSGSVQKRRYDNRLASDANETANRLLNAWPCATLPQCRLNPDLYDVEHFISNAQSHFSSCHRNLELKEHLTRIQKILNQVCSWSLTTSAPGYSYHPSQSNPPRSPWLVRVDQLLSRPAPLLQVHDQLPLYTTKPVNTSLSDSGPLHQLIATAEANAVNPFQRRYVSAFRSSAKCFEREMSVAHEATKLPTIETLEAHYTRCRDSYFEAVHGLKRHLGPMDQSEQALEQSGLWPRITPNALFRFLASNSQIALSNDWKMCLRTLALLALGLQRARRLLRLHIDKLREELCMELENEGCNGWIAQEHPDWLLVQLQGNFLVRRVQAEVANEMISPRSGNNTAMQLNMGEGKSSVIIPIVSADLANGTQLVRVITPKALTVQMCQILVERLGGIANRRVYFLRFSRSLAFNYDNVSALHETLSECMREGGILVIQPESVLSLKLVTVEKQQRRAGDARLAQRLLQLQMWIHSHSRDVLDESDEILHVRYQLVYTIGLQQHMEGFPERWTTTQQVLALVNKHASSLRRIFSRGVDYECGPPGAFPHLRILHADAGQKLTSWIVQDVINGLLTNFNFGQLRSDLEDAIKSFISRKDVSPGKVQLVKNHSQRTWMWGGLLLLRGLLAGGVLLLALREKRWRVDYGLAPVRTMLAVPYRAKDVPAQTAEFGHPDIAIILTCLSYYYGGLSEEQLRLSFEILFKQVDPSLEYDLWVRDCAAVPEFLRTLSGVNIKSSEQWNQYLFPLLSKNQATVDFYLSSVVFPKEAKEFPSKLSCSGWDLAEKKENLVTGFSGTNDGQYLLPLHITQRDPDHQRGTNAKVLSYLLQPENQHYMCMSLESGGRRTTCDFLKILVDQKPTIRVLLDVGAQMLDLQNWELAAAWLDVNQDASAAIYFSENDELTVRTRDGSTQLFLSSSFALQLDQCVVYLDDAHTRGTDIKFPSGFRAAVTLGPKVTKDRLTQGCMRMRKLGRSHSIMFFAPLETDRRIRFVANKDLLDVIDTMDILHWAMRETCEDTQKWTPHWALQGMDHESRYAAWTSFCNGHLSRKKLLAQWLQPEAKRLEDLYAPHGTSNLALSVSPVIHQRCTELGIFSTRNVSVDEEQEREIIHEVERNRPVEPRPPRMAPSRHSINKDLISFVNTGVVPRVTSTFRPVFKTLDATSAVTKEAHIWSPNVLATKDFQKTVYFRGKLFEYLHSIRQVISWNGMDFEKTDPSRKKLDDYLRPVQWIISGKGAGAGVLVILSPHEVNHLMPYIRSSKNVHLHLYTPRTSESMMPCDDLALYSIPTVPDGWTPSAALMDQLNLFAGQLYLKDYETYVRLCRFLCVYTKDLQVEGGIKAEGDGFILPENRPQHLRAKNTFKTTPIAFLRILMGTRRRGVPFGETHMGKLLDGKPLSEGDFE